MHPKIILTIVSQVPDCSTANLTIYAGFKEFEQVLGVFCGDKEPPKMFTSQTNSISVVFQKADGSKARFIAKWKRATGTVHRMPRSQQYLMYMQ